MEWSDVRYRPDNMTNTMMPYEAVEKILLEKLTPASRVKLFRRSEVCIECDLFGRADLFISLSRAKFDEEVDLEVRLGVAPQKPRQISENQNFRSKIFVNFFFV